MSTSNSSSSSSVLSSYSPAFSLFFFSCFLFSSSFWLRFHLWFLFLFSWSSYDDYHEDGKNLPKQPSSFKEKNVLPRPELGRMVCWRRIGSFGDNRLRFYDLSNNLFITNKKKTKQKKTFLRKMFTNVQGWPGRPNKCRPQTRRRLPLSCRLPHSCRLPLSRRRIKILLLLFLFFQLLFSLPPLVSLLVIQLFSQKFFLLAFNCFFLPFGFFTWIADAGVWGVI